MGTCNASHFFVSVLIMQRTSVEAQYLAFPSYTCENQCQKYRAKKELTKMRTEICQAQSVKTSVALYSVLQISGGDYDRIGLRPKTFLSGYSCDPETSWNILTSWSC